MARVVVLGAVAGAAAVGAWRGTLPLVVVAGLALFVAALGAVEPMAQAADHPGVTAGVPGPPGRLLLRNLVVPGLVMLVVGLAGLATAALLQPSAGVLGVGVAMLVGVVAAPVAGAALSVLAGAPQPHPDLQLSFPEMATLLTIVRQAFPRSWPWPRWRRWSRPGSRSATARRRARPRSRPWSRSSPWWRRWPPGSAPDRRGPRDGRDARRRR